MNEIILQKLRLLPDEPGVYKMFNANGEIIYVGKAVNLKNRVKQYFQSSRGHDPKVAAMVSNIADFEFIIVNNETEALTLESNLIKQNKPHYNILLKDDKHFPYVRIDMRKPFPYVEIVRKYKKDGAKYFGPYLSAYALRDSLTAIREHFPIRHCKKDISKAISRGERPCLLYHIGKCCAPCAEKVSKEEYAALINSVAACLQGNCKQYVDELTVQMKDEAGKLNFEKAALLRDRIKAMETISQKQSVSAARANSYDVFSLARCELDTMAYGLFVREGNVIGAENYSINASVEQPSEIMAQFLVQFYLDSGYIPNEIVTDIEPNDRETIEKWLAQQGGHSVSIHVPKRGEKLQQCKMAHLNAEQTIERKRELTHREWERGEGALAELAGLIGLDVIPHRMECFDNSHFQGRDTVGSMVVFIDGKAERSLYRRFKTKQKTEGDDYLAMREHLTRRFERTLSGDEKFAALPDLLIVDGGRGQLNVALEVLSDFNLSHIAAIGLAERNEEIILPNSSEPIVLPMNSPVLHLLQRIRDEAHRFAITYHRNIRSKNALYSILDDIDGIGDKRKRALYDHFTTLDAIKNADVDALASVRGMNCTAAKAVYDYFHKMEKENAKV